MMVYNLQLSEKSFWLYNQFLKTSTIFPTFFTSDAVQQLESVTKSYKTTKTCPQCKIIFKPKDSIKICMICYELFHFSCSGLTENSSKKCTCFSCQNKILFWIIISLS